MTSPEPSATRPLRVAGLVLLGVAAIALVIGLVSIFAGNGNGQADNGDNGGDTSSPAATSSPSDSPTEPPAESPPETPETSPGAPTTTTTAPPGSAAPTVPPGGDGNGEPGKTTPVRVLNNSTVGGLAAQAAADLRESGWTVADVGNYSSGVIPTTTVYFRPGTAEESAAELLADEFGMRVEPRFAGLNNAGPGLIVIVTGDYQGPGGERHPTEKNDK